MRKVVSILILILILTSISLPVLGTTDEAQTAANKLHTLGLFSGVGKDSDGKPIFELDRVPTRIEAITMLVRLLGKESEATNKTWSHPFNDVPTWAEPYVGYAYNNGLTSGISNVEFGSTHIVSLSQYLTFILRALGYKDDTDFQWDEAQVLTDRLGITKGANINLNTFTRGDITIISFRALSAKLKGTQITLINSLYKSNSVYLKDINSVGLEEMVLQYATRADIAHFIVTNFELESFRTDINFTDIDDHDYKSDILAVASSGILNGVGGERFDPNGVFNREQFAVILHRIKDSQGIDLSSFTELNVQVTDENDISAWAYSSFCFAVNVGILTPDSLGKVYPQKKLTIDYLTPKTVELMNKTDILVPKPLESTYCDFNQTYIDQNGMEVKASLTITEKVGSFVYKINYSLKNTTLDKELDEKTFKLFFSDGSTLEQYGFFGTLFPSDTKTRSYEFEFLKSKTPTLLEYDGEIFGTKPRANTLKWKLDGNK